MLANVNLKPEHWAKLGKLEWLADVVVQSYKQGKPVVVLAKDYSVLHGEETLRAILGTGVPLEVVKIKHVDRRKFEGSDLPEICEAARRVWLENKFSTRH